MKLALVTTSPAVRSGIGDYTRHLLPYLERHCDVSLFVEPDAPEREWQGRELTPVERLEPRRFDQVLYQLGNERNHAFMARMVRALGGSVVLHDWVLFDMTLKAYPALVRGGLKGHLLALREGGPAQAAVYARNWLDRRRQRVRPIESARPPQGEGTLLSGWHEPEEAGRWTADAAWVRLPEDAREVELDVHVDAGRTLHVGQGGRALFEGGSGLHALPLEPGGEPFLRLETTGIRVTRDQRAHGDSRRLGTFVRRIVWRSDAGERECDLSEPCAFLEPPVTLSRDRFLLPLNRSVVRFADAFLVHSDYVRRRVLEERNAATPIGVVYHGAEARWRDGDRRAARRALGLDESWQESFLVVSFGGVQRHKRIDRALEALALARRERPDVRLVLAGSLHAADYDPIAHARQLRLSEVVRCTGFVPEEEGWEWLHAGDVALNLRGPSTGGSSGGIFQAFSMGRPVIATDAAEQRELPDSCTVKIPLGNGEVRTLARALVGLRDDAPRRAQLEEEVRRFVESECHWRIAARRYAEHLERFPRARAARRKLFALRAELARTA